MTSNSEIGELVVKVPSFDVKISDPFTVDLRSVVTEKIALFDVRIALPPLLSVEVPLITASVDEMIQVAYWNPATAYYTGFDEVLTAVPLIAEDNLVSINQVAVRKLKEAVKERLLVKLEIKPNKIIIEPLTPRIKSLPSEVRDMYAVKVRLKLGIPEELREILENKLTKEFKITRMIKRMEVIPSEEIFSKLRSLLKAYLKTRERW